MATQSAGDSSTRIPGEPDCKSDTDGSISFNGRGSVTTIAHDGEAGLIFALQLEDRFALTRYLPDGIKDRAFHELGWNFLDGDKSLPTRVRISLTACWSRMTTRFSSPVTQMRQTTCKAAYLSGRKRTVRGWQFQ
ncbi:hypothetical protein [Pseudomonas sp. NFACC49-2]|uniref:hypothetical protein n=3 Tax=Pseudomonas TaxID=286 RepID=UPI0011605783|nr:hypothetical protein [Pseudomonas sp. NFACC49-2]